MKQKIEKPKKPKKPKMSNMDNHLNQIMAPTQFNRVKNLFGLTKTQFRNIVKLHRISPIFNEDGIIIAEVMDYNISRKQALKSAGYLI